MGRKDMYVWGYGDEIAFFDHGAFVTIPIKEVTARRAQVGIKVYKFENFIDIRIKSGKVTSSLYCASTLRTLICPVPPKF